MQFKTAKYATKIKYLKKTEVVEYKTMVELAWRKLTD